MSDFILHGEAINALAAADYALAHVATLPIEEPHTVDTVTQEWVGPLLARNAPGALLQEFIVSDSHDGMTRRKKWNLVWNDAGKKAGLPESLFIKATPDGYQRETISMLHMGEVETNFYNVLQPEVADISPQAYYARSYLGGRYIVLMEDIEARGLRPYWLAYKCSLEHAFAVVKALAQLHSTYWQSARFDTDLRWVRPRTVRFGAGWMDNSFIDARRRALEQEGSFGFTNDEIALVKHWNTHFHKVYAYWETLPATVQHGDAHLGNTFAKPDGGAGYFDWQLLCRGSGLRDVAHFILSALSNEQRREHERTLVERYFDHLEAAGIAIDRNASWRDYTLWIFDELDAVIKTTVRGGYGHASEALERIRVSVCGAIADHDAAGLLDTIIKHGRL